MYIFIFKSCFFYDSLYQNQTKIIGFRIPNPEYEYFTKEMDRNIYFYIVQKEKIIMHIKVSPGKALNKVTGIANNELCLNIKAPPEKGKANKEIIRFFAKTLDIPRSDVIIKSGQTNRHKTIILPVCVIEKIKNIRRLL